MKTIGIISLFCLFTAVCESQNILEADLPANVRESFKKAYPNEKAVKWEKEKGNYEAEFEVNKVENSVVLDTQGNILEKEMEISISDLPKAATDYVRQNYGSSKIKEASRIMDAAGNISYEAEVAKKDLIFDANGKFIKVLSEDGDDKEDDKK